MPVVLSVASSHLCPMYYRRDFQQETMGFSLHTTGGTFGGKQLAPTYAAIFLTKLSGILGPKVG